MTTEEQIRKMYEGRLNSQKTQLQDDYNKAVTNLDAQKQQNQETTDANLNRTAVEANKRAMNDAEYYAASGLTSGARAQARMARDNQVAADMATIRAAQQAADADIERERGLLAKEYDTAIRKAQSDNDMELAEALYKQAQADEERLTAKQKADNDRALDAAKLLAEELGDYTSLGKLYGWTPEQIASLNKLYMQNPVEPVEPEIYNHHNESFVEIPERGRVSYSELKELVDKGLVEEAVVNGKIVYTWLGGYDPYAML
jgi:membrane protein involved in colicin uptake